MSVWVVFAGKDEPGLASIHASLAGAYGAARKYMDEVEEYDSIQTWGPFPDLWPDSGTPRNPFHWSTPGWLYSCWIEEIEVRP